MTWLACDPGLSGAFAMLDDPLGPALVIDMPMTLYAAGGKEKRRLDVYGLLPVLRACANPGRRLIIEDVHGAPGQSGPAAFTFGYGVGCVVMAAIAEGYAIERIAPAVWKRALRVPTDKRASRARASELLPASAHLWPLQKHDGRAEAAMIALYAERYLK